MPGDSFGPDPVDSAGASAHAAAYLQNSIAFGRMVTDGARHPIRVLHTLGPAGTNCQRAARYWLGRRGIDDPDAVRLFPTLEEGAEALPQDRSAGLLGCVVYPRLHDLVFRNLDRLRLLDCFVLDTHEMLLAGRGALDGPPRTTATHAAPASLVPGGTEPVLVDSNAAAARACSAGLTDACITTAPAAREHGLRVLQRFGPVPMGFTVHGQVGAGS